MEFFKKTLEKILMNLCGLFLMLILVLAVSNIIMRTLGRPILGTYEGVTFLTSLLTAFSIVFCALAGGHISVNLLVQRFSIKVQAIIDIVTGFIASILLFLTSWNFGKYAHIKYLNGEVSETLRIPTYPFNYIISLCLFFMFLIAINNTISIVISYFPRKELIKKGWMRK